MEEIKSEEGCIDYRFLFENYEKWLEEAEIVEKLQKDLLKYKGHLLDSAEMLLQFYKDSEIVEKSIERMDLYNHILFLTDMQNEENKKYQDKIYGMIANYNVLTSFVIPELLESDESIAMAYCDELEELKPYKKMLQDIYKQKEHMLSEPEEAIISEMQSVMQNFSKSSEFIRTKEMDFKTITLENGEEIALSSNQLEKFSRDECRDVRRQVALREDEAYERHKESLATNYIGFIKCVENISKYRKYNSYLEEKLDTAELTKKTYETFKKCATLHKELFKKYIELYKKALKLPDLKSYDIAAPLTPSSKTNYSIEEAKKIILDTFSIYGGEYSRVLEKAFDEHCIDYFPRDGKTTMWLSSYIPYEHPLIISQYTGKLCDISSLSHELGHFVNQYLSIQKQLPPYVFGSTFTAEIASLTNEIVFSNVYRNKTEDITEKKELLGCFIKVFAGNFFGAAKQALFEEKAHQSAKDGIPLSSEVLAEYWNTTNSEVMGDLFEKSKGNMWAAIPHFFMGGGHYTFNYSTAIVASTVLASKLLNKEEGMLDRYMHFLTLGSSVPPLEALKALGIDMENAQTYEIAFEMFDHAIDELSELLELDGEKNGSK